MTNTRLSPLHNDCIGIGVGDSAPTWLANRLHTGQARACIRVLHHAKLAGLADPLGAGFFFVNLVARTPGQ